MALATVVAATSPLIDNNAVGKFNRAIRELAAGKTLIDLHRAVSGDVTVDGIHLNGDGYKLWTAALVSGAKRATGCNDGGPD
ncbi:MULTISPECIES: hypothetical protein [unclassified Bradyrhizobium]|uniref:hypothetical protein n=1 Tax=unclassified Bradyrhizobium TaxID=2631580 RepID=UPI001FFBA7C5|nr:MULTISPECIES: hypothetical protein [unclassified Bradyrhizobium]MCK1571708.1 hypothetical protein [Bradyrhizobium sp. 174]UPJ29850.1 hypothetical protein IVB54_12995 [Bradyrhizobium sp. CW1]UPJ82756.1 hypothetical protein IVB17_12825 [Bradyrhizobium sp. 184]UPJ90548.1 hypothetical protein IVB16_12825 [Bradyrhizobium sp. 183]